VLVPSCRNDDVKGLWALRHSVCAGVFECEAGFVARGGGGGNLR
jgi:hypothetical protein